MKIKKLTFLINGTEVAGVMVAQPLLQLFQPLLLHGISAMVSCEKGEAPCLGRGSSPGAPSGGHRALPSAEGCGSEAAASAECQGGVREVLPRTRALGAGCGAARSSLAGLRLGLALPQRGVVPAAPSRSDVRTARSCCRQELCFLSYDRQEIFREGGRQR